MVKILLVDDEDTVRNVLSLLLETAGYDVQQACDGNHALESFRNRPVDLIITDIVMPGKEGLELIRSFLQIDPGAKIIAISGGGRGSSHEYLELARRFGAQYALAKPFSRDEVLAAVNMVMMSTRELGAVS
jgi:YesN/AraC family two-component response regulator